MKDKAKMQYLSGVRQQRADDGLGPTSDIGIKLRALYGAVQDETIPDKFLELLERLDEIERRATKSDVGQD